MATNALIAPNTDWIAFQSTTQVTNSKPNGEQWNIGYRNEHGVHGVGEHDDYMLVGGFCTKSQALMMAAAPALLEALEDALEWANEERRWAETPDLGRWIKRCEKLEAAIASARGAS